MEAEVVKRRQVLELLRTIFADQQEPGAHPVDSVALLAKLTAWARPDTSFEA